MHSSGNQNSHLCWSDTLTGRSAFLEFREGSLCLAEPAAGASSCVFLRAGGGIERNGSFQPKMAASEHWDLLDGPATAELTGKPCVGALRLMRR